MSGAKRSIATIDRAMGCNAGRQVRVVGGGIAGLAAAVAFARQGATVTLQERDPDLRAFGAGLQITPNGLAVLSALGLRDAVNAVSLASTGVCPHDGVTGRLLARLLVARPGDWRLIHRGDLVRLLADAAVSAGVQVQKRVAGGTEPVGDITVGADGLHSGLRAALNPGSRPFFTGQVAWRAVVPGAAPPQAQVWMAPGWHAVTYPLPGNRTNLVAVREQADWVDEGWSHAAPPGDLFATFPNACTALRDIFDRVSVLHRWGLFRHPVAARWQDGARALIGDAAHPTLPFLAQGANLALEDAFVLAARTDAAPDVVTGLAAYELARKGRVTRAIAAANANARSYHLRGPARIAAHLVLRTIGAARPAWLMRRYDWLYGHDVTRAAG